VRLIDCGRAPAGGVGRSDGQSHGIGSSECIERNPITDAIIDCVA
jgi:hypothetical protein